MPATLNNLIEAARARLPALRRRRHEIVTLARGAPQPPSWRSAFTEDVVGVIAEVKRRSPSAGEIARDLDPAALARAYGSGGACAVSVLTEREHFGGSLEDLESVRASVSLPVLRKDFLLDPVQVYEARAAGASAVLLIVRALDAGALADLVAAARDAGLGSLVEVHDRTELDAALATGADVVGVNSRDLDTFSVDVDGVRDILRAIPAGVVAVAESGLAHRTDVERVAQWGADAVLVGTALARSPDPAAAVRALVGVPRRGRRA